MFFFTAFVIILQDLQVSYNGYYAALPWLRCGFDPRYLLHYFIDIKHASQSNEKHFLLDFEVPYNGYYFAFRKANPMNPLKKTSKKRKK